MKKLLFLLLISQSVFAQVSTFPNSIGIGQNTLPTIPLHINKDGEVARVNGVWPYFSFYDQGTWIGYLQSITGTMAIGTKNSSDIGFYTNDVQRFKVNGDGTGVFSNVRFNAISGLNLIGSLRVAGNNVGSNGDVLMSLGNTTPVWSSINQNPQVGFQAFLSASINLPSNAFTNLTNFIENFDDGNAFNHATGAFTAPSAGLYFFKVAPSIAATPASALDVKCFVRAYINSNLVQQVNKVFRTDANYGHEVESTFYLKLLANDVVDFSIFQLNNSSTTLSTIANSALGTISGYKIY